MDISKNNIVFLLFTKITTYPEKNSYFPGTPN